MPFNLTRRIEEKELLENLKEFMDTIKVNDEYDAIILGKMLMSYNEVELFTLISPEDRFDDFQGLMFGVNDIIRMVKGNMTHKTAFNHIKKLIDTGYLIDVNELVIDTLDEIDPIFDKTDTYPNKVAKSLISKDLLNLAEEYNKANKKRLIINLEKVLKP